MNFEELVEAREGAAMHREEMPVGAYYKKLIDKKYRNIVELKPLLTDSIAFCEALKADERMSASLNSRNQMHFTLQSDSGGPYEMELEQGNYLTLEQLLRQDPAIVATKGFVDGIVEQLAEFVAQLNERGVYQLCLAPQSILIRKGDHTPLLLTHGSLYLTMQNQSQLYSSFKEYVAPEVLEEGRGDERSDVFAFAKLLARLYSDGSMPVEMKRVVTKATDADPDKRYASIGAMRSDLGKKREIVRSALMFVAALAVAALGIFLYFDLMPQASDIEFVEGSGLQENYDDVDFDRGFDATTELGVYAVDSAGNVITDEEMRSHEEYQAKAEQIFRKRFTEDADRILSKIYTSEFMSNSEKNFMASSQQTIQELMDLQVKYGREAGLTPEHSQAIASEIIDRIAAQKRKQLPDSPGFQRGGGE